MDKILIDFIRDFLLAKRDGISVENLKKHLNRKKINKTPIEIINEASIFKLKNGLIFYKESLSKIKKDFIIELDDYLLEKISDKSLRKDLINNFILYIPDILYAKWMNIPLERKLIIFELLYSLIIKPKSTTNAFKTFYNSLIDFYSSVVIYSILIININDDEEDIARYISKIEPYDELLEKHLYNCLTIPDVITLDLPFWEEELSRTKTKINTILSNSFSIVKKYSIRLLKRVIENEFKDFNNLILLSRFENAAFYNWISTILDKKIKVFKNLFEDLGL